MAAAGVVDLGQLARERHGDGDVVLVGFGGHRGTVLAAAAWDAPVRRMPVPPAREGSLEAVLHAQLGRDALLALPRDDRPRELASRLDHRAVGVAHSPARERWGNDVPTVLAERYDAFVHLGQTQALRPLHGEPESSAELGTWPYAVRARSSGA